VKKKPDHYEKLVEEPNTANKFLIEINVILRGILVDKDSNESRKTNVKNPKPLV
jgi:hypothetical protein